MKIGVKTYNDKNYIDYFKDKVDFIEVMSFANEEYLRDTEIVIHCKHGRFGINPANENNEEESLNEIKAGQKIGTLFSYAVWIREFFFFEFLVSHFPISCINSLDE